MLTTEIETLWLNLKHDILKIENCTFTDKFVFYDAKVLSLFKFKTVSRDPLSQKQMLL